MKYFRKNIFRAAKKNIGTYIGASLIIALGIFVFISMNDTLINLRGRIYEYYQSSNMADIFAETIAMPESKLKEFEAIEGIEKASGVLSADIRLTGEGIDSIVSLHVFGYKPENELNKISLKPNAAPENEYIYIGRKMLKARNWKEGQPINLIVSGESYEFIIAGMASAPNYVYAAPPSGALISDGKDYDIAVINAEKLAKMVGREKIVNEIGFKLAEGYSYEQLRYILSERLEPYGLKSIVERQDQASYSMVDGEIEELLGTGTILPIIFLFMSIFMMYTVLKKIIDNDRSLIGTMKAMGLKNSELIGSYMLQGVVIAVAGVIIGSITARPLGIFMFNQYAIFFSLPSTEYYDSYILRLYALIIALAASLTAVFFGVRGIVSIQPAEAMRPASPNLKQNFSLFDNLIKKLSAMYKMGIRSLFRSPFRTLLLAFAIAFPFALSITLFSSDIAIDNIFIAHFENVQRYDVKISLENYTSRTRAEAAVAGVEGVAEYEAITEIPVLIKSVNRSKFTLLAGLNKDSDLLRIYGIDKKTYNPSSKGLIMNSRIAADLGLKKGDTAEISTSYFPSKKSRIPVIAVIEESMGSGCYIDINAIGKFLPMSDFSNTIILNTSRGRAEEVKSALINTSLISAYSSSKETLAFYKSRMRNAAFMINMFIFMTLFAGAILIYNISLISIRERKTEFATLKIMGITDSEIKQMIFIEQVVYLIAGIIMSIPMIFIFKRLLESLLVSDAFTLKLELPLISYIRAFVFSVLMLYISSREVIRTIKKISPTDSLKEKG